MSYTHALISFWKLSFSFTRLETPVAVEEACEADTCVSLVGTSGGGADTCFSLVGGFPFFDEVVGVADICISLLTTWSFFFLVGGAGWRGGAESCSFCESANDRLASSLLASTELSTCGEVSFVNISFFSRTILSSSFTLA